MEVLEQAAYEVEVYENRIDILLSIHNECAEPVLWHDVLSSSEPDCPVKSTVMEDKASQALNTYQPSFWARLFRREAHQRASLTTQLERAKREDEHQFQRQLNGWSAAHSSWLAEQDLAKRILAGDRQAKLDAIEAFDSFSEISHLGAGIQMVVHPSGVLEARLAVHGSHVIPAEIKSLLKSGKLSTKTMPTGRFNELHQGYVCGCALRVGRELLAVLPDDLVIVTALDNVLNSSTGHMEELPILSVAFSRQTIHRLNLDAIDPSDAMKNFVHNMSFKKGAGFSAVTAMDAQQFSAVGHGV